MPRLKINQLRLWYNKAQRAWYAIHRWLCTHSHVCSNCCQFWVIKFLTLAREATIHMPNNVHIQSFSSLMVTVFISLFWPINNYRLPLHTSLEKKISLSHLPLVSSACAYIYVTKYCLIFSMIAIMYMCIGIFNYVNNVLLVQVLLLS